ncbi:hypothetical protein BJ742DRAFT_94821 [Cladochytrium replicatum]|nr:hypothetical protein BJ742DRAFT_94821 [Cladochytrium replicatum]
MLQQLRTRTHLRRYAHRPRVRSLDFRLTSCIKVMAIISNHENSDGTLAEYFASSLENFNSKTTSDLLSDSHGGPRRPSAEQPSACHCSGCSDSNAIHHVGQLSPSDAINLCKSFGTLTPQLDAELRSAPTDNNITENKKRQRKRRIYYLPPWIVPLRGGTLARKPSVEDGVPTPKKSSERDRGLDFHSLLTNSWRQHCIPSSAHL